MSQCHGRRRFSGRRHLFVHLAHHYLKQLPGRMHPVRPHHPNDGRNEQQQQQLGRHELCPVVQFEYRLVDAFDDRDVDGPEPGFCGVSPVRLQLDRGWSLLRQAVHVIGRVAATPAHSHESLGPVGGAFLRRAEPELAQLLAVAQPVPASAQPLAGRLVGPSPNLSDSSAKSALHGPLPSVQQTADIRLTSPVGCGCYSAASAQPAPLPTPPIRRTGSLLLNASVFALQPTDAGRSWSLTLKKKIISFSLSFVFWLLFLSFFKIFFVAGIVRQTPLWFFSYYYFLALALHQQRVVFKLQKQSVGIVALPPHTHFVDMCIIIIRLRMKKKKKKEKNVYLVRLVSMLFLSQWTLDNLFTFSLSFLIPKLIQDLFVIWAICGKTMNNKIHWIKSDVGCLAFYIRSISGGERKRVNISTAWQLSTPCRAVVVRRRKMAISRAKDGRILF